MSGKNISQSLASASSAGGFKVVFVHGVLSALENEVLAIATEPVFAGKPLPVAWAPG